MPKRQLERLAREAKYTRSALEEHWCREAARGLTDAGLDVVDRALDNDEAGVPIGLEEAQAVERFKELIEEVKVNET